MKSKKYWIPILFIVIGLFLAACGSGNKEAASVAIKAAEDSYGAVKGDVLKYIPDQAKGVEDAIKGAKENFDKGNFDAALAGAKPIPDKVKELTTAVAAKKAELSKSWEEMSGGLPQMLEVIKSRLDILSASKKLAENMDKAKLDGAKGGYEEAAKMWDEAKAAFSGGNVAEAVAKARTVKERAVDVMTTLGMQVPAAAAPVPALATPPAPAPVPAPATPPAPAPKG